MRWRGHPAACGCAAVLLALVCQTMDSAGQNAKVSVSPPPGWVRQCDWSMPTNRLGSGESEGSRYLLYECQQNPQRQECFTHVVLLLENETGVQDSGSLTFGFDPSFQKLLLHQVCIRRDGKVLDRLDPSKVKIIQPEPGLEGHVFTGRQTAVLFVEDLRVGDALEYAYTLRGANPILAGHFSTRFLVQTGVPVDRQRLRVVWSSAKPLYLRQHLTTLAPKKATWKGATEYVWDFANLESISCEDALPASYEPYPYVEFSDFDSWSRVVEWALPLYASDSSNLAPELRDQVAKWQAAASSDEEKAGLALNFVQDELRYTGLELGPDSYRPAAPGETFRLRYGDCKAKAHLLCTMLRAMHIQAYPALVNTLAREAVAHRLPSPFAFNHVIVKLLLSGKTAWVDPTRSHQGGLVWDRYLPPLGKALVIREGVTGLEDIPPSGGRALQHVTSTFWLKNYDSPTSLTVRTAYHGSEADAVREYFAWTDAKEIAHDYLNFYARYYPGIRELRPLETHDDRTGNLFEVTEHYQIRDFWELNKSSRRWEAAFYAEGLDKFLTAPKTRLRKMPLRIPCPLRREQVVVVHLPDDKWNIPASEQTVDCDAFVFHYRRVASGSIVRFFYDCQTKVPVLPAGKVGGYLKKLEAMQNLLGDTLYRPDRRPGAILAQINWLMVVVAGFGLAASAAGCAWAWRFARPPDAPLAVPPPPLPGEAQLEGLGGWLVLVGLGLCLTLLWRPVAVARDWQGFFSMAAWQAVAVPGGEHYHPLYGLLLIFEVLGNMLLLGLNALAVGLFFTRRRLFPKIYIALLVANAAFLLADELVGGRIPYVAQSSDGSSARQLSRAIVQAVIWCWYMLVSQRVKATFVR